MTALQRLHILGQQSLPATYNRIMLSEEEKDIPNQLTLLLELLHSHRFPINQTYYNQLPSARGLYLLCPDGHLISQNVS